MMNRRTLISGASFAVAALAIPAGASVTATSAPEFFYHGDPVMVARFERDGSLSIFEATVNGSVYRPVNEVAEYRERVGHLPWEHPTHSIHYYDWPKIRDEAHYEAMRPSMEMFYFDRTRDDAVWLSRVAHISDPGGRLHRWFLPGEPIDGEWKWEMGSISPESSFAAIDRDPTKRDWWE